MGEKVHSPYWVLYLFKSIKMLKLCCMDTDTLVWLWYDILAPKKKKNWKNLHSNIRMKWQEVSCSYGVRYNITPNRRVHTSERAFNIGWYWYRSQISYQIPWCPIWYSLYNIRTPIAKIYSECYGYCLLSVP